MANTLTFISSVTVGSGGQASITFSSIPATYTDLLIKISARGTAAGAARNIAIAFNGSSANYTMRNLVNEGGTATSYTQAAYSGQNATGYMSGSGATASTFSNSDFYFTNYASSNYKSVSIDSVSENNVSAGWVWLGGDLWSSTSAITSITFTVDTGNFEQYSTAYLYGIKNS
jgi:hypothetical protein